MANSFEAQMIRLYCENEKRAGRDPTDSGIATMQAAGKAMDEAMDSYLNLKKGNDK